MNCYEINDYFQSNIFQIVSQGKLEICIGVWQETKLLQSDSTFYNSSYRFLRHLCIKFICLQNPISLEFLLNLCISGSLATSCEHDFESSKIVHSYEKLEEFTCDLLSLMVCFIKSFLIHNSKANLCPGQGLTLISQG